MIKVEVGVLAGDETVWPADYRTWARPEDLRRAVTHVLKLADATETVAGRRITEESK